MTKDHSPHWRQIQEKSFQNHEQSSSGAQEKSTELTLLEVEMCKHKKNTSKQKKNEKESQLKREHRNSKRRQKDKS